MRVLALGIVGCCVVLVVSDQAGLVVGVQTALTLLVVAVSIPVTRRLHDNVPSAIRAGVASGVGTLTWLAFVPFALIFGAVSESAGLDRGALLFVAVGVVAALLMLIVLPRARSVPEEASITMAAVAPEMAIQPAFPPDRFLPPDDPDWPGHWAAPPAAWTGLGRSVDSPEAFEQARAAIADMPQELRQVIVLRDVQGRSPSEVREALDLSPDRERSRSTRPARSAARLERSFERAEVVP